MHVVFHRSSITVIHSINSDGTSSQNNGLYTHEEYWRLVVVRGKMFSNIHIQGGLFFQLILF